jgi:raffinose/stachyose/melibiose transport system substrate-binding protein
MVFSRKRVIRAVTALATGAALLIGATGAFAQGQTITLKVRDTFTEAAQNKGMMAMIEAFEKENPGIRVQRDTMTADAMRPVIQAQLTSNIGPDVFYYDTGPGFAGVLAKADLLRPIDGLFDKLNHLHPWTRTRTTFGGKTYGIGNEIEFLGVYYNKDIFDAKGLKPPTTYEEFLGLCEKLKTGNKAPISFGNLEGWPAFHMFSMYANNMLGKEKMESLLFKNGSWDQPEVAAAIKAFFVDLKAAKCIPNSPNALKYDDSTRLFIKGDAPMLMTGTWLMSNVSANAKFKSGWFFLPKAGGGDPLPPVGLGSGYFISKSSKNPEAAEKFLAFLFNPANAKMWTEQMSVTPPYAVDLASHKVSELQKQAIASFQKIGGGAATSMGYNIDVLTPDAFNTVMKNGFQSVLLGKRTPEVQAAELEKAMAKTRK